MIFGNYEMPQTLYIIDNGIATPIGTINDVTIGADYGNSKDCTGVISGTISCEVKIKKRYRKKKGKKYLPYYKYISPDSSYWKKFIKKKKESS